MFANLLKFILPALGGVGGSLANRPQTTNQSTNQNASGSTTNTSSGATIGSSTSTPNLDPDAEALKNRLTQQYMGLSQPNLGGMYNNLLKGIGDDTRSAAGGLGNFLASRGLGSTAGAGIGFGNILRGGLDRQLQASQQLPQLQFDNLLKSLGQSSNFFSAIPTGQTSTTDNSFNHLGLGSSEQQSQGNTQSTTQGNQAAGFLGNFTSILANLFGQGAFNNNNAPNLPYRTAPIISPPRIGGRP